MNDTPPHIRNATPDDLPAILRVEESWPATSRAGADKFLARIEKFSAGFFLACLGGPDGRVVATITTMPAVYDAAAMKPGRTWNEVTNHGYLYDVAPPTSNGLYIVSGVIDQAYRGHDIFAPMVLSEVTLARRLGLRYVFAGAVIPGYRKYCRRHGEIAAGTYCRTRHGKHLVDPLLAMYEAIGFSVPDERHVLAGYYPDSASRDYAAMVVRDLTQDAED